jgi:hypothetical protein
VRFSQIDLGLFLNSTPVRWGDWLQRAHYTRLVTGAQSNSMPRVCFFWVAYDLCGDCPWLYDEVIYSILSLAAAHDWHSLPAAVHGHVLSDRPDRLQLVADQVVVERLERRRIAAAMGRHRFVHRLKLCLLMDLLSERNEPLLYLDGDTVVQAALADHLRWLAPGHSLLHRREGAVGSCVTDNRRALPGQLEGLAEQGFAVTPESTMFNAGAIGIHPADRARLETALAFTDAALELGQRHIWEQLGVSLALDAGTRVRLLDDAVVHYWYARQAHHRRIADELATIDRQGWSFGDAVEHLRQHPLAVDPPRRLGLATRVWRKLLGRSRPQSLRIQDRIARMADWQA